MRPRFPGALILMLHKKRAREKLVVFLFIEPGAFDVEELQAGHADGERECIDRQLRDGLVGARTGFVVENVHGVVSDLQKVDMAGDGARRPTRRKLDPVSCFEVADLVFGKPNRNLDGNGARVVREHEILQRLVPQLIVADGRDDECGGLGRRILFAIDDEAVDIELYHRQVYAYAYHRSKLALLRRNPQHQRFEALATFLETIPSSCPHELFRRDDDPKARASQAQPAFADINRLIINRKENTATETAALIIPAVGSNKLRHETLQNFMLANDSSTFAVEIPIWLTEDEISALKTRYGIELAAGGAPRSITGHIDFLQVRNDAVHILDYKPDARTNKPIAQLAIYALALTIRVPGLKLFDIKCAWFNEEEYNEFFPRTLFAKH